MSFSGEGKWETVSLGELAEFKNGVNYSAKNFGKGMKVINVKDFQDYTFAKLDGLGEINPVGIVREKDLLKEGDILFVRSNGNRELIGRSVFLKGVKEEISHSAFTIRARFVSDKSYPRFFAYLFKSQLIRKTLSAYGGGTNISNLNQQILNSLQVLLPPIETQHKIVSILSAYDGLIENNTCRIKVLEEMAQTIYREWFVNFRFPGHERVKMVDSPLGMIPEGWKVEPFGSIFSIKYGKTLPKSKISSAGDYPVYGAGSVIGFFNSYISQEKVTLITCRGNGSGTVWRTRETSFVTNNSLMLSPVDKTLGISYSFVELLAKHSNISGVISGSAQPQITIDGLNTVPALLPAEELIVRFCKMTDVINNQIDCLYKMNKNLHQTRDMLLPKLTSGAIDVSILEVEI